MGQAEFEKQLSKTDLKRRLIEGGLTLVFFVLFIVSYALFEGAKEVIVHDGFLFIPSWTEVNYNHAYTPFIIVGLLGGITTGCFLLMDLLFCKYVSVEKDGHHITIHRAMLHNTVYVNGKEVDRLGPFFFTNVIETRLPNNIKLTISFSRAIWYIAHISFSDDTPSMEV